MAGLLSCLRRLARRKKRLGAAEDAGGGHGFHGLHGLGQPIASSASPRLSELRVKLR